MPNASTKDIASGPAAAARKMWALGDYHRFARETIWEVGAELAAALSVGPGLRVLDVAAGTGNFALRAAAAGGQVVALDLTPENFEAGRREAESLGVQIDWVEGDAQALPFPDGHFDVVGSVFGAIFAPDQQATAAELARVCRSGGAIGMTNFTPEGVGGRFFGLFGSYSPPAPPGSEPPLAWGIEDRVRSRFEGVGEIRLTRKRYVERAATTDAYRNFFYRYFGPIVALRQALSEDPQRLESFDNDFAEFTESANRGSPGGPAEYPYEYLQVIVHKT